MTITELIQELHQLSPEEKLRIVQLLVNDLAAEEEVIHLVRDQAYEIWSPYDSADAAFALRQMLQEEQSHNNG